MDAAAVAAAPVRDVGFLAWRDPRAWMEPMRGPRWDALKRKERGRFDEAVKEATMAGGGREAVEAVLSSFEAAREAAEAASEWVVRHHGLEVHMIPKPGGTVQWSLGTDTPAQARARVRAGDLQIASGGRLLITRDAGKGGEHYILDAYKAGSGSSLKKLWTFRGGAAGMAQGFAVLGDWVYILEADKPLQFKRLVRVHLESGKRDEGHLLYQTQDPSISLTLVRGENECLFLLGENAGRQSLWYLRGGSGLEPLSPDGITFFPVGAARRGGEPCYFVKRGDFRAGWEAVGRPLESWKLPRELQGSGGLEGCVLGWKMLQYVVAGQRVICSAAGKGVARFMGEVGLPHLALWLGSGGTKPIFKVGVPGATPTEARLVAGRFEVAQPSAVYGDVMKGWVRSADGTQVRWVVCWNGARSGRRPRALLVTAYGAYGIPTLLDTSRWRPYIEAGWAIGFALVRGGGDGGPAWAEAGRRAGKGQGVEDLEACVRALQEATGLRPLQTCVFGRSAGGYLVGAAVARQPRGDLFRTAYCEVPYVDVLRTSSNPALPLTALEYLEFGDPARKPDDFEAMLRLSPVDALGSAGAPGVFVLCRTAAHDMQVFAYESFKWMDALRGEHAGKAAQPKLLALTESSGHFAFGQQMIQERTEDFLLLQAKMLGGK